MVKDSEVADYTSELNCGKAELNSGVMGSFAMVSGAPSGVISVDASTGIISVDSGLEAGTYTFKVEVTGTGNYTGTKETEELTLVIE